jgi:hypothetical protein
VDQGKPSPRRRFFDTLRNAERVYKKPLHTPFAAIQDTAAFATCP